MPDIPEFDAPPNLSVTPMPQASAEPLGVAGEQLAQGAERIGATFEEFNRRYQQARRTSAASSLIADNTKQMGDLEQKASLLDDHVAAVNQFNAGADQIRQKLANIQDPFEREMVTSEFEREAAMRQISTSRASFDREIMKHRGALTSDLATFSEQYAQAGYNGNKPLQATLMDRATNSIKAAEAAGWINGLEAADMSKNFTSTSMMNDLKQKADILRSKGDWRGLDALSAEVENPANYPGLMQDHRNSVDSYAQGWSYRLERRAQEAQARAAGAAVTRLRDTFYALERGDPNATPMSDAQITAAANASGQDPRLLIEEYHTRYAFNRASNQFALSSLTDDQKALRDLENPALGPKAPAPGTPAFKIYKAETEDRERVAKAARAAYLAKLEGLRQDPVGYVLSRSPDIATAFADGAKDPKKLGHAIDLVQAQLAHIGIAPQFGSVLPKAYAEGLAYDLQNNPANAPLTMQSLKDALGGDRYARVMKDLTKYGHLATAYNAISSLDDHRAGAMLGQFYSGLKPDEKGNVSVDTDLISETDRNVIKKRISNDGTVKALMQSMLSSNASIPYVTDFQKAIYALAYSRLLYHKGETPFSAAEYAISQFNGNRKFAERDGAWFAPQGKFESTQNTADAVFERLDPKNIQVPDTYGDKPGLQPVSQFWERLRDDYGHTWTMAQDGEHLELRDFANRFVRDKTGKVITVPIGGVPGMMPKTPPVSPEERELLSAGPPGVVAGTP